MWVVPNANAGDATNENSSRPVTKTMRARRCWFLIDWQKSGQWRSSVFGHSEAIVWQDRRTGGRGEVSYTALPLCLSVGRIVRWLQSAVSTNEKKIYSRKNDFSYKNISISVEKYHKLHHNFDFFHRRETRNLRVTFYCTRVLYILQYSTERTRVPFDRCAVWQPIRMQKYPNYLVTS